MLFVNIISVVDFIFNHNRMLETRLLYYHKFLKIVDKMKK